MAAIFNGDRVYHKDDPRGDRGTVLELRDFGDRGVRALVKWDGIQHGPAPTWCGLEYLRHDRVS